MEQYRPSDNPNWPPPPDRQDSGPLQALVDGLPIPERARELLWALITDNVTSSVGGRQEQATGNERAVILACYDSIVWKLIDKEDRLPTAEERREALFQTSHDDDVIRVLSRDALVREDPGVIERRLEEIVKRRKDIVPDPLRP